MSRVSKNSKALIYNESVRKMVNQGDKHQNLNCDWANVLGITFFSANENEVLNKVRRNYSEAKGFVIEDVIELKEYEFI